MTLAGALMKSDEIFILIKKYLVEEFEIPEKKIYPEAHLFEDLELDSIDALDMAAMLESELDLEVVEDEFKKIRTIKDIIDFILKSTPQT